VVSVTLTIVMFKELLAHARYTDRSMEAVPISSSKMHCLFLNQMLLQLCHDEITLNTNSITNASEVP